MSIFSDQGLFDSRRYFSDNSITCWMACLMSWTKSTPFDSKLDNIETFQKLMENRKWQVDDTVEQCNGCHQPFSIWIRKHHCRLCGNIFCHVCSVYREVKCCYRSNLNIRACQSCFATYSDRIHRFHQLQSQWMLAERRVSDCTIQNHPKLNREVTSKDEEKQKSENSEKSDSDSIGPISTTSLGSGSPFSGSSEIDCGEFKPIQTIACIAHSSIIIKDSRQISRSMYRQFYVSLLSGIFVIGAIITLILRLSTEDYIYISTDITKLID